MILFRTIFDILDIDPAVSPALFKDFILAATPYYFPKNYGVCEANNE